MAKTKTVRVTDEELLALQALREARGEEISGKETNTKIRTTAQKELADAFIEAIERTRPPEKKNPFNRKVNTPWSPKNGEPRVKMKRKYYQHGITIGETVTNEDIELLNRVRPGRYCDGWVHVELRKDRGINITYPVRTSSQRLKLVNQYGVRSFTELLQRVIDEKTNPTKYRKPEDAGLYDLED